MSDIRHGRTILQQRDLKLRAATYIVTILSLVVFALNQRRVEKHRHASALK